MEIIKINFANASVADVPEGVDPYEFAEQISSLYGYENLDGMESYEEGDTLYFEPRAGKKGL